MGAQGDLVDAAVQAGRALADRGWRVCVAESCTGGALAEALTSPPGSSAWFDRAFVVYSNSAKVQMLGVAAHTLDEFGAVSGAVVSEMAAGALMRSESQVAVALSGVAGPGGGSETKPVGTVCMAVAVLEDAHGPEPRRPSVVTETLHYSGDRAAVRNAAVRGALAALLRLVQGG